MNDAGQMHDLIWFLIVGGLAGWLASVLVTGGGLGVIADIVIGILGAFVGGFLANTFGFAVYGFWGVLGVAVLGAVVLLSIIRVVKPSRRNG
ncbi:MAG TPA: GlsB/YeaQ/YmgE family stress response membrane protein [bacterium]|jgi:uncharacterized membrane protein YeaQ/YmgE (transglycosylase-associated protein family)|nr:GlsB/YeaQ/YmgE family stress response membrane protein [bacterium]